MTTNASLTHVAVVQMSTETVYGVGLTSHEARKDAAQWVAESDGYSPGAEAEDLAEVRCSGEAAAYVIENGGARSPRLVVTRHSLTLAEVSR